MATHPSTSRPVVGRSRMALLLTALLALIASTLSISLGSGVDLAGADASRADNAFTLDGNPFDVITGAEAGASGEFGYLDTQGPDISPQGRIWIAETESYYWVAFLQSRAAKSNIYCERKQDVDGCYQEWDKIWRSDYMTVRWAANTQFSQPLSVSSDFIDPGGAAPPFGGTAYGIVAAEDATDTSWGDTTVAWNGAQYEVNGSLYSFFDSPIAGMSTLHYNHNTLGWTDLVDSPNFTADPDHGAGYIYEAGVELRIAKDIEPGGAQELPDGIATTLADPAVVSAEAHNSPDAPLDGLPPEIVCIAQPTDPIAVGDTATFTFRTLRGVTPESGQVVFATVDQAGTATVVGMNPDGSPPDNRGITADPSGEVVATVRADAPTGSNPVQVVGIYDVGDDGIDAGDPRSLESCTLDIEDAGITAEVAKTNDADLSGSFTDDETARDGPGQDVTFEVVVTNTSTTRSIVIDSLEDRFPDGAPTTTIPLNDDSHSRLVDNTCDDLIDDVLAPGEQSAPCTFIVADYAPEVLDSPLVDRVYLEVHEEGNVDNTATDDDGSTVRTVPVIDVTVDKTNDADTDDQFTDDETAPNGPDQDVDFRVEVTNDSNTPVIIDALRDEFPLTAASPTTIDLLAPNPAGLITDSNTCDDLAGMELATAGEPGDTATCTFTAAAYAPGLVDSPLHNLVHLGVHQEGDDTRRDTDVDDSTVRTEGEITAIVDKTNDADTDGRFSNDETAADGPGQDVDFHVVVSNTSANAAVVVDALRDEFPDGARSARLIDLLDDDAPGLVPGTNTCDDLRGVRLARAGRSGDSAECEFTVAGYSPQAADSPLDNRVFLEVHMDGDDTRTDTDNDDSRVRTAPPAEIAVAVDKRNDADGDGGYSNSETAPAPGQDVPFRVVVTNTGPEPIVIDDLVDRVQTTAGTRLLDLLTDDPFVRNTCVGLAGDVLAPGESTLPCFFTLADYSPPRGDVKDNTAIVEVFLHGDRSITDSARDDSRVRTPEPGEIDVQVIKTNDADRDGTYRDTEVADDEGVSVSFQAIVVNSGDVEFTITELSDSFLDADGDTVTIDLLSSAGSQLRLDTNTCTQLDGVRLAPGERTDAEDCTFTVNGYAPEAGTDKDDTVTVTVEDDGDTDSDEDDSRVRTPAPSEITVTLIKTNDANTDGEFTDFEFAEATGDPVQFNLTIMNTSDVPVTVTELTDVFPPGGGTSVDLLTDTGLAANDCDEVFGDRTLQPDEDDICFFTVANYAPEVDDLVNEATVTVTSDDHETSDNDVSTVGVPAGEELPGTQEPPAAPPQPAPAPQPRVTHPRTGIDSVTLGGLSVVLLALGGSVLLLGDRRRRYGDVGAAG